MKVGSRKGGKTSAISFYPSFTNVTKPQSISSPRQGLRAPPSRLRAPPSRTPGAARGVFAAHAAGFSHEIDGDVVVDVREAEAVDCLASDYRVGGTGGIKFPRERNQLGVGREVGHFPVRYPFAVLALQSAWLANFKTPLAWPAGRGPTGRRCVADGQSAATGSGATSPLF